MQDFRKAEAKRKLFAAVNAGQVRVLIGSTQTMGTGVNAQQRLIALHHLDVPWLPSDIEQREGRIHRQGNQNPEIRIFAYATRGSVDATSWQLLERKSRFIAAALGGDRTLRRLEDADSQVNQFALAKALASGDPRLLQKAGLEAELERLRAAHLDDQLAVRRRIEAARHSLASATRRIAAVEQDLAARTPTRGEQFTMDVGGTPHAERKVAGALLLSRLRTIHLTRERGQWTLARIGGFAVKAAETFGPEPDQHRLDVWLDRHGHEQVIELGGELTPLGLVARLEYMLDRFEAELAEHRRQVAEAGQRLPGYERRLGEAFPLQADLDGKRAELAELEASLAATDQSGRGVQGAGDDGANDQLWIGRGLITIHSHLSNITAPQRKHLR